MSAEELLEYLIVKYSSTPFYSKENEQRQIKIKQQTIRSRIVVFIKYWITTFPEDFSPNNEIFRLIEVFIKNSIIQTGFLDVGKQLLKYLYKIKANYSQSVNKKLAEIEKETVLDPIINNVKVRDTVKRKRRKSQKMRENSLIRNVSITKLPFFGINILEHHPKIISEQLTIYELQQFKKIKEYELLHQHFTKNKLAAPNVIKNSVHFNQLGSWIWLQILSIDTPSVRARAIKRILMMCIYLYELKNYNAIIGICAGLNNSAISRLRITWNLVGYNCYILKESFAQLTSDNSVRYRSELQSASPPLVPFIGTFLTDLTFLEDGNPNFVNGKINFYGKFNKISQTIKQLLNYQDFSYGINIEPTFMKFFDNLPGISSTEAFSKSEELESRDNIKDLLRFDKLSERDRKQGLVYLQKIREGDLNSVLEICRGGETLQPAPSTHSGPTKVGTHRPQQLFRNTVYFGSADNNKKSRRYTNTGLYGIN